MKRGVAIYILILALSVGLFILTGFTFFGLFFLMALIYGVISILVLLATNPKLKLEINGPAEIEKEEVYNFRIKLLNENPLPVLGLKLTLSLKNLLTEDQEFINLSKDLLPKRESNLELDSMSRVCGMMELGVKEAFLLDLLGFFKKRVKITYSPCHTLVLPETEFVQLEPEDLERYDMESFKYADGKVGSDSSETAGIREYVPGDSIKGIHWKLTAKSGDIMVKEYGLPVDTKLMVIVDMALPDISELGRDKQAEVLGEFAISVSKTLLEKEIRHEFGWFDKTRESFERKSIGGWDDYQSMTREFLSSGPVDDGRKTVEGFLESEGSKDFAGFLYITLNQEKEGEVSPLKEYGNVAIYSPR